MRNLAPEQLKKLYSDFCEWRDNECNGYAKMEINDFYLKNRDKYDNKLNQCDGCARNLPVVDGLHRLMNGYPVMACASGLYA